jgi:hypothetical protein
LRTTARKLPCQALPEVANRDFKVGRRIAINDRRFALWFLVFWFTRGKNSNLPSEESDCSDSTISSSADRFPIRIGLMEKRPF